MGHALKLPDWQLVWVRDVVAARCGLYLGGPHEAYLSGRVAARMQEMQVDFAAYARILQESPAGAGELQTLIERLCVYETSFMRDPTHFQALARFILPQLAREAQQLGRRRLRIVSAGCSTGQEAYSLAMVVQEARELLGNIEAEIVGLDVSGEVIEQAARGVYPARELVNLPATYRERYFMPLGAQYQVVPALQRGVRWLRCNLSHELPVTQVDLIFCRNVLIYFQEAQRDAVVRSLASALRQGGFLVPGYADSLRTYRNILDPVRVSGTVVFRRISRPDAPQSRTAVTAVGASARSAS